MWSLSSWLKNKDETVLDMQEPLLQSDGPGSYAPPSLSVQRLDGRPSRAASDQLPVSDRLPISTQPSSHLISFSCPATPDTSAPDTSAHDTSASERDEPTGRQQTPHYTRTQSPSQHASPEPAIYRDFSSPKPAPSSTKLNDAMQHRIESDSEDEMRHACGDGHMASHVEGPLTTARHSSRRGSLHPDSKHNKHERELSHEHNGYCKRCKSGSLDRRPSRELIGARRPSRYTQDSQGGFLGRAGSLTQDQLVSLPPSPFSILHNAQQELLRSPSSHDEIQEYGYADVPRRPSSTPRETNSAANSRRSSMLSRLGSNQAAPQDQAIESMQSLVPQNYSWVPVMHADAKGNAITSYLHHPSLQHACDALKLWHGALKWVALWMLLSLLTLLHAAGLVHAMANVSLAKVCAGLFCWTGVLGLVGSSKGLISECLVRHRADQIAAANALGLKSVSVIAFLSAVLSCLACLVHAFVLNLVSQKDPHLPPCSPQNPLCTETYTFLLVLMVATMTMYGAHSAVSAVVAHRAHHARQILRNGSILHV